LILASGQKALWGFTSALRFAATDVPVGIAKALSTALRPHAIRARHGMSSVGFAVDWFVWLKTTRAVTKGSQSRKAANPLVFWGTAACAFERFWFESADFSAHL
jgi:hypothetical protein